MLEIDFMSYKAPTKNEMAIITIMIANSKLIENLKLFNQSPTMFSLLLISLDRNDTIILFLKKILYRTKQYKDENIA